jgi:hypothetical protein
VLPHHYFEAPVLDVTFRKAKPNCSGGKFNVKLSLSQSIRIPNTDLRICYSSSGGSFKNLTKYLVDDLAGCVEFHLQWRDKQGEIVTANGLGNFGETTNGVANFEGLRYQSLTMNTFRGMCGATLTSKRKPIIFGIHLGGRTGTPEGCAGILKASLVNEAISQLREVEGVLLTGSAENFEAQVYGVTVLNDDPLHPKSPLNYLPENSQIEYYGSCPGMSTFRSNVQVTPISEHVTDVLGEPNIYGPPVINPQWEGWQKCLASMAEPAKSFDPDVLIAAIKDYKSEVIPIFKSDMWKDTRPLTDKENLCGIPGKKFIDPIPLNTSIGYPLKGPKRNHVIDLEPTEEFPNNRELTPEIRAEIKRCEDCYRRGERAYTIAKACKKDEVLSKRKCRIFYGNPIALTFLVRKYFLPILRVLQFNPKVAECAVGVNSHGPEWQELHEYILKYGIERLFGGDYKEYDMKLISQVLLASIRIKIDCSKECAYTDEDRTVMEAMAGDIVFAVIAFNGDLIGLTEGGHISGNSLTVILNSICGSLNLRCFMYRHKGFQS